MTHLPVARQLRQMKVVLFFIFCISLDAPPLFAKGGGGDPGGGESLSKFFAGALRESWKVVGESINFQFIDDQEISSRIGGRSARQWYKDNAHALATNLRYLKVKWVRRNKNNKCGQTKTVLSNRLNSPTVFMSYRDCESYTFEKAVEHWIGEGLHHFGFNDIETADFASYIRELWIKKEQFSKVPAKWVGFFSSGESQVALDTELTLWIKGPLKGTETGEEWARVGRLQLGDGGALSISSEIRCATSRVRYWITYTFRDPVSYDSSGVLVDEWTLNRKMPASKVATCGGGGYGNVSGENYRLQRTDDIDPRHSRYEWLH